MTRRSRAGKSDRFSTRLRRVVTRSSYSAGEIVFCDVYTPFTGVIGAYGGLFSINSENLPQNANEYADRDLLVPRQHQNKKKSLRGIFGVAFGDGASGPMHRISRLRRRIQQKTAGSRHPGRGRC